MIKHIVMWKLKEGGDPASKDVTAKKIKADLEALKGEISEIQELEVGINMNAANASADVVLYSTFNDLTDLDIYRNHPAHEKVVAFVKEVVSERTVVDYEA